MDASRRWCLLPFFCDLFVWLAVALVAGVGFFSEEITAAGGWFVTREK
jgi:hypothetical protein